MKFMLILEKITEFLNFDSFQGSNARNHQLSQR